MTSPIVKAEGGLLDILGLSNYDLHTAEVAAGNLLIYADEIDCSDATHPCERCRIDPATGAQECPLSDRGECGHDKAEELRDVAKLLAKLPKPTGWLAKSPRCEMPPAGWACSRQKGHEGPCAAYPVANEADSKDQAAAYKDTQIAGLLDLLSEERYEKDARIAGLEAERPLFMPGARVLWRNRFGTDFSATVAISVSGWHGASGLQKTYSINLDDGSQAIVEEITLTALVGSKPE